MAEDIGLLVARVVADTEQFRTEMTRVARQLETNTAKMNAALSRVQKSTTALSSGFRLLTRGLAALGVAFSIRGIASFVNQTFAAAEELANLSDRLDISVESLSKLQYVAKITDVDFGRLTTSLEFMVKQLGEAQRGGQQAREAFKDIGVDFRVLATLPVDKQFEAIAEALYRQKDATVQANLATKAFGRTGVEILQITNKGAAGIRALGDELQSMGGVLTGEQARAAAQAKDELDKLTAAVQALARAFTLEAAPAITRFIEALRQGFFPSETERQLQAIQGEMRTALLRVAELKQKLALEKSPTQISRWNEELRAAQLNVDDFAKRYVAATQTIAAAASSESAAVVPGLIPGGGGANTDPFGLKGSSLHKIGAGQDAQSIAVNESIKENEQELTDFIKEQNLERERSMIDSWLASRDVAFETAQQEKQIRADVTSNAIGLLSALGAEHRGAAIAALIIQKALAIKEIFVNAQIAKSAALWMLAVPGGQAMYAATVARISTFAAINAGLVAATGLVEAAQISHGGTQSTLGTSANPIATTGGSAASTAASSLSHKRDVVEIHLNGNFYGWDDYVRNRIVDGLRDAIDGKDVVIIGPDSRQAGVLVGG